MRTWTFSASALLSKTDSIFYLKRNNEYFCGARRCCWAPRTSCPEWWSTALWKKHFDETYWSPLKNFEDLYLPFMTFDMVIMLMGWPYDSLTVFCLPLKVTTKIHAFVKCWIVSSIYREREEKKSPSINLYLKIWHIALYLTVQNILNRKRLKYSDVFLAWINFYLY